MVPHEASERSDEESRLAIVLRHLLREDPSGIIYHLKTYVSVSKLLKDRRSQVIIDAIIRSGDIFRGRSIAVTEQRPAGTSVIFVMPFELARDDNFYYFHTGHPAQEVPAVLRPTDVVPSLILATSADPDSFKLKTWNGVPFNKPLHRVSMEGGPEQIYNYNTSRWDNGSARWEKGSWHTQPPTYSLDSVLT